MELRTYAIERYKNASSFLKLVLTNFPDTKLDEQVGEAETARTVLKHVVGTPHWWMKRAERAMPFRAEFESVEDVNHLLDRQNDVFAQMLQDDENVHWTPTTSIPWIMIRSANHMMHHASMLIFLRHIWGLPSLGQKNPWGSIMDYPGKSLFEKS